MYDGPAPGHRPGAGRGAQEAADDDRRRPRRAARGTGRAAAIGLAGGVGLCWHFARYVEVLGLSPAVSALIAAPLAALVMATLAALIAAPAPQGASRWARWPLLVSSGLQRAAAVVLPLALLPVASWLPSALQAPAGALLLLASLLALTWLMTRDGSGRTGPLLMVSAPVGPATSAWRLCLLALALTVAAAYLVIGSRVVEIAENDGAYYYGVARHIARTGRFEEPIVWHFLGSPARVVHAPFDYWGAMTSLLLAASLLIFGTRPETAFLTISAISAATLLAFWYLICRALPLRYWSTQLLALLVLAFSPAMIEFRFQPESIAVAQLFIVLALVAFVRRRLVLAVLLAFGLLLTRGDGLFLFGLVLVAAVVDAARDVGWRGRAVWTPLAVGVACLGAYVTWSAVSFGTLTPPGPQRLPFLRDYWEVFDFGAPHEWSPAALAHYVAWDYLSGRIALAWLCFRQFPWTPAPRWWFALTVLPALTLFRHRPLTEVIVWGLFFGGFFLVVWISGPGFYVGRTPHAFTPLAVLAGALGADVLLAWLDRWVRRGTHRWRRALPVAAAVFGLWGVFLSDLPPLRVAAGAARPVYRGPLAELDERLRAETVASNIPWYMIAYTRSPAVSIPFNGEQAIAGVLERYGVRWLVISGGAQWAQGESRGVVERLLSGDQTRVGRFRLRREVAPARFAVFRVDAPGPSDPPPAADSVDR